MTEEAPGATKPLDVLVFTPTADKYGACHRLEPETVKALFELEWDGALSYLIQRDNPYPSDGRANVLHQYQRGRQTFLAGRWDAMLVIESDIIPMPDLLKRLAAENTDLAYGLYMFRSEPNMVNLFERYPGKARNHGESLTVWPAKYAKFMETGHGPVSGGGLGAVLIRRKVLEAVDFRHAGDVTHCDSFFTMDVYAAGFTMSGVASPCGHKTPEGNTLWPPEVSKRQPTL